MEKNTKETHLHGDGRKSKNVPKKKTPPPFQNSKKTGTELHLHGDGRKPERPSPEEIDPELRGGK